MNLSFGGVPKYFFSLNFLLGPLFAGYQEMHPL
jgi:hypothetical protein